jgi:copper/silver efflux system protein
MIKRVIELCTQRPGVVFGLVGASLVYAVISFHSLSLDALPDLSDPQVIVYTKWPRSPEAVQRHITRPLILALNGVPGVKTVRGITEFGFSSVFVIFDESTDTSSARAQIREALATVESTLPAGVQPQLGPDGSSVGWVYQYALVDRTRQHDLAALRSFHDRVLKPVIQSAEGVAEIASVGGHVKQIQILVNQAALQSYNIPWMNVVEAVVSSSSEAEGSVIEVSGAEYMIRSRGNFNSLSDIESLPVFPGRRHRTGRQGFEGTIGKPILLRDIAVVTFGPAPRRGLAELNGEGEVTGGIVVKGADSNALHVIQAVKEKIASVELPKGVEILPMYDRSELIHEAVGTLSRTLIFEMLLVTAVIVFFLRHPASAVLPLVLLPVATLLCCIPMALFDISSHIMSLSGIALAIGMMVDAAIVMAENVQRRLEQHQGATESSTRSVMISALQEVGPSAFFSLAVMTVSFLPIFALEGQSGRLLYPLAVTKSFALAIATFLTVTLVPALRAIIPIRPLSPKRQAAERAINEWCVGVYEPVVRWALKHPKRLLSVVAAVTLITVIPFFRLGAQFMPTLEEGSLLYMPTTVPGISIGEAKKLLQLQDELLKSFPEVKSVFGKAGRADTATDIAPLSMMETTIVLKPQAEWPEQKSLEQLIAEMDSALRIPGVTNGWTMPIRGRIDMLSTGLNAPVGVKVLGDDLRQIEQVSAKIEALLKEVRGTRNVYAERIATGSYIDITPNRQEMALRGVTGGDLNMVISTALGGEVVGSALFDSELIPMSVRLPRELRDGLDDIKRLTLNAADDSWIPLHLVADVRFASGPGMIREEDGRLVGTVVINVAGRNLGEYAAEAQRRVAEGVSLPVGMSLQWTGQFEEYAALKQRLMIVVPLTLALIAILLFLGNRSWKKTGIILLAVPFSAIGAIWFIAALGYPLSLAVWVGFIALLGLDAETGVFMLLYLDLAIGERKAEGRLTTDEDLTEAIVEGAARRLRPKLMTVATAFFGLLPVMFQSAAGSEILQHMAAPMIGGLTTSFLLELLVYPVLYRKLLVPTDRPTDSPSPGASRAQLSITGERVEVRP